MATLLIEGIMILAAIAERTAKLGIVVASQAELVDTCCFIALVA